MTRLLLCLLSTSLLLTSACDPTAMGDTDPEDLSDIYEDACNTASGTPRDTIVATSDPTSAPPAVARRDVLWVIELDGVSAGESRYVMLDVEDSAPEGFVFLSAPMNVEILATGDGPNPEVFESSDVPDCTALAVQHVAELPIGRYLVRLTPDQPMDQVFAVFTVG